MNLKNYNKNIQKLFTLGRDKLSSSGSVNYSKLGISEEDAEALFEIATDDELQRLEYNDKTEKLIFAPIHAVEALAELKNSEFFGPILDLLIDFDEDDYLTSSIHYYIKQIEDKSFKDANRCLQNELFSTYAKNTILSALSDLAEITDKYNKEMTEMALDVLKLDTDDNPDGLYGFAVVLLYDAGGIKNIEEIRKAFKTKPIDTMIMGDLEDIEIKLCLRNNRDTQASQHNWFNDNLPFVNSEPKIGRNDTCPCGSGKKYKRCCLNK